MMELSGWE